jgi:hypothetical protein
MSKILLEHNVQKSHPDYESFKKTIFRLKLEGSFDTVMSLAYKLGYAEGHEFGKTMGQLIADDLDSAYDEYKKWLDEQLRD